MLREVSAILLLALGVAMSSSGNVEDIWHCPTVNPVNTSIDQLLGGWYMQEMTVHGVIPGTHLCVDIEIAKLQASDSGNKSFTFLTYALKNDTERMIFNNKTMDVSSEYPGVFVTREMGHLSAIVAETDDRKLICLVTCRTPYRSILETFIFSRDKNADPGQIQAIRNKVKAAGINPEGELIVRNSTMCKHNTNIGQAE